MIRADASTEIKKPVDVVFAWIDDVPNTAKWVEQCRDLRQTSPGPKGVGTRLHYTHKRGEMDGEVLTYEPQKHLHYKYTDKAFDVIVDFRFAPVGDAATRVDFYIEMHPKTLFARVLTPVIRKAIGKQTDADVARLKSRIEAL